MRIFHAFRICVALNAFFTPAGLSQTAAAPEVAEAQAKYDEKVNLEVLRPHEIAVAELDAKFAAALDLAQEAEQKKGNLEDALAIKMEKAAVLSGKYSPPQDDTKTSPRLKNMRATYRAAVERLAMARDKKLRPLKAAFAKSLDVLALAMTKKGKLGEAMALKKMREDVIESLSEPEAAEGNGKETTAPQAEEDDPAILGKWVWRFSAKLEVHDFQQNGIMDNSGKWEQIDKMRRTYKITWADGYVHTVTLDRNGQKGVVADVNGRVADCERTK